MEYKTLGNTAERVPEIGLGTWRYAGGQVPLRMGIALGATLIDTAERYGTEEAVGDAIRDLRKEVFLATKVRHEHLRYADVLRAAENSLRALGVEHIDLYQIHRPNPEVPLAETMEALDELVAAGKVRYIGVSNFSVAQCQAVQSLTRNRIVANQLRYSLADRTIEAELLPWCRENGITVIAYSPLARSMEAIRSSLPPGVLEEVARQEGRTPAQVALNWCTARDNVIAIPRASTVEHVGDVCAGSGWRLSDASLALLDGRSAQPASPA